MEPLLSSTLCDTSQRVNSAAAKDKTLQILMIGFNWTILSGHTVHIRHWWVQHFKSTKLFFGCFSCTSMFYANIIVDDDDDCFYIVLFSALEQTRCARM